MTAWSLEDLGPLAHAVHYGLVVGGLAGVAWLLVPTLAPERARRGIVADEHAARVALVRSALAAGTPTHSALALAVAPPVTRPRVPADRDTALMLPLALVASTSAAGVHAAMGPAHLEDTTLFGVFFAAAAVAQLGWTASALGRVTPALLGLGVLVNAGCLALWLQTRVSGLPLGLMPQPEAVGGWDLAAAGWELVAVVACVAMLRPADPGRPLRAAAYADWSPAAKTLAVASPLVLATLTFAGAGG